MLKKSLLIILAGLAYVAAFGKQPYANTLLRDGMALSGVDGRLIVPDTNGIYYFRLDFDLRDDKAVIEGGTDVELLPSTGLEKMTANIKQDAEAGFRVWGKVTIYKGRNYFFIDNFLSVSQVKQVEKKQSSQQDKTAANKSDDELQLPAHILEKLTAKKIIRPVQLRRGLDFEQDHILADRTGFIVKQPDGSYVFVFDALEQIRFKVAGIVTKYKGSYYLLLRRARRVYSYGNFGR